MATTWSSDHSTIYRGLQLCLAIANDLSLAIELSRIDRKVTLIQPGHQFNSYNLMHNQESWIRYKDRWNSRKLIRCTGTYLDYNNISILVTWCLWSFVHPLYLLHLNFYLWLHVIYRICKRWETLKCAMHEVKSAIWCMATIIFSI
jgi:hypothetical protein